MANGMQRQSTKPVTVATVQTAAPTNPIQLAISYAKLMDSNETLAMHMEMLFQAKDISGKIGATVYHDLLKTWSAEQWAALPPVDVDREYKDAEGKTQLRNQYSRWEEEINGSKKAFDLYAILASKTMQGAALQRHLELIKIAKNVENAGYGELPDEYKTMSSDTIQQKQKQTENRIAAYKSAVKTSVRLWQAMARVNGSDFPFLRVEVLTTMVTYTKDDGTEYDVEEPLEGACVKVIEVTKGKDANGADAWKDGQSKVVTVGGFLAFKLDAAFEKGGKWSDLMLSASKKKGTGKDGAQPTKTAVPSIERASQAIEYWMELSAYVKDDDKWRTFMLHMANLKSKGGAEYKDAITSIGTLHYQMASFVDKHTAEYDAFINGESKTSAAA